MEWLDSGTYLFGDPEGLSDLGYVPYATGRNYVGDDFIEFLSNQTRQEQCMLFHYTWRGYLYLINETTGEQRRVSAGQALLAEIPSKTAIEKTRGTDVGVLWLMIRGDRAYEICHALINESTDQIFNCDANSHVVQSLVKIFKARQSAVLSPFQSAGLCFEFMMALARINEAVVPGPVQKAQRYIQQHISDPNLDVQHIVDHVGKSRYYFSRAFKKHTGHSLVQFIQKQRMDKAVELLMSRQYKVKEVADIVGYTEPAYFNAVFKKHFGYSPGKI